MISVAVDFDTRDFVDCAFYTAAPLSYDDTPVTSGNHVNINLLLNTSFQLTGNLTLTNSKILFEPSQTPHTITVPAPWTLTLIGDPAVVPYQLTFLGGCKNMWGGIIVEPGGSLVINGLEVGQPENHVVIEDANIAVLGDGNGSAAGFPSISINHATFNKNIVALQLEDDNFNNSSAVAASLFKCDGGVITKDINNPIIFPERHISLLNAENVLIGGGGNVKTQFKDARVGILANSSDLEIEVCEFIDLKDNANPPNKGTGIVAVNFTPVAKDFVLDEQSLRSRFNNLRLGIGIAGNINVNINQVEYFRDMDYAGISLYHGNYNNSVNITAVANFQRNNIGVLLSGSNLANVEISGNTFTNTDFIETSTGSFHNTAISIQSAIANPFNVLVSSNQIADYRIGIHAVNVDGIEVTNNGDNIALGIHMFNHDANFSPNEIYRGIWLQNCPHAFVAENVVSNVVEITSSTTAFRGIDIEECVRARINCNEVSGVAFGMNYIYNCSGTLLRANELSLYQKAINLDNATLGPQVQWNDVASDFEPLDNLWNDLPVSGTNPSTDRVTGTPTGTILWHYRSPASGNYNPLDGMSSQFVNAQGDDPGYVNCYDISDRVSREVRFGAIVGDSLEFDSFEKENTWIARKYAYECMKLDTTILYQDSLTDGVYLAFYQREDSLNTGKFSTIRVLSSDSATFGNAESMNELVFDEIDLETNLKFANQTYFNKIASGDTLNESDTTSLMAISELSYYSSGEAFYMSIGMLGLEKSPNVPALRIGQEGIPMAIETLSKTKSDIIIYPNPATYSFSIQSSNWMLQKVEVYDSQLRLVQEGWISESHHNFPVLFKPGIYGVKVIGVNNEIRWLKLIII